MATTTQDLIAARTEIMRDAFEHADADKMMSVMSKDIRFSEQRDIPDFDYPALEAFYKGVFSNFAPFQITSSTDTGTTPEFSVWELTTEAVALGDIPPLNAKVGDTVRFSGVSLIWWQWEGQGEWNDDLSKEGVLGWKIVKRNEYFTPSVIPAE